MAKATLRLQARELRKNGKSIKTIAELTGAAKSSVSVWVRDIVLTSEQKEQLVLSERIGIRRGQLLGGEYHRQKRLSQIKAAEEDGRKFMSKLTKKELLLVGLALYWGEGSKKSTKLQFCNSDPKMIQFLLLWLGECFGIRTEEIRCRVGINEIHKERDVLVKKYWSEITRIPLQQFETTSLKHTDNRKVYTNLEEHYGTLSVNVIKPAKYFYKVLGLINALQEMPEKYDNFMPR